MRETHLGNQRGRDLAVAIDPHGKVHYGQDHVLGDHAIAVLGEQGSDTYLAELRADEVSYVFAGPQFGDLDWAMNTLGEPLRSKRCCSRAVGRSRTNGMFLRQRLIDEVSVLVHPAVGGLAGVPSIFEYPGAADERPVPISACATSPRKPERAAWSGCARR